MMVGQIMTHTVYTYVPSKYEEQINKTYWWAQEQYMNIMNWWDVGYHYMSDEESKWNKNENVDKWY